MIIKNSCQIGKKAAKANKFSMRGNEIIKTWFKLKNDRVRPIKNVCDPFLNDVRLESPGRVNPKVKREWSSAVESFLNLQSVGQWWSQT